MSKKGDPPNLRNNRPAIGLLGRANSLLQVVRWTLWGFCTFATLTFLMQPVSVTAQLLLSISVVVAMLVTWSLGRGRVFRFLFLGLGSAVAIRYLYWRITTTLPSSDEPLALFIGLLLLGAELYCVFILTISVIVNADPLKRPDAKRGDERDLPTVDVFIPTYNEEFSVLALTVASARSLDYPPDKFTVWLLDDGGSDQKCSDKDEAKAAAARERRAMLQALCRDLGARYSTRARNEHAKAGNLNAGLAKSTGEIVVVFDADHAPFRSFLRETVGEFAKDPKLFLVQTPHVFLNPDPIERNLQTFARMPSENEMFYAETQRGLDKWDGSFFCGSAALLRRAALEEAGGFSGVTITEDCETAFELHSKGWHSAYIDKPLIAGLQPDSFIEFIGQRSRWCQGMFQILMLKNPAFKKGLSLVQRLAYLSSMAFWFFPIPRLIFMFAPLLHIFFDIKIFVANIDEAIAFTLGYMVVNVMLQNYLYGKVRWPWVSELYEYAQGVYLAKAIVSVVWSPRKPTFNVTAKGQALDNNHLSPMAWPFIVIFLLLTAAVVTAAYRYAFEPGVSSLMLVVGLWAMFNLVIAGVALGVVAERSQPDRFPRLQINRSAHLVVGRSKAEVIVTNVSAEACSVALDAESFKKLNLMNGEAQLIVDQADTRREFVPIPLRLAREPVRQGDSVALGFQYKDPSARAFWAIADLMYGDATPLWRFLQSRRKHMDVFRGTFQFLIWSVIGPARAFAYGYIPLLQAIRTAITFKKAGQAPAEPHIAAQVLGATNVPARSRPALAAPAIDADEWIRDLLVVARAYADEAASLAAVPQRDLRSIAPARGPGKRDWLASILQRAATKVSSSFASHRSGTA